MNHDNVIALRASAQDMLRDMIAAGAKLILAQAIEEEVQEFLERHEGRRTEDGLRGVVRNGYLPERTVQTGVGPVPVRIPKTRVKDGGEPAVFRSGLAPPYVRRARSLDAAVPWLYLKGVSTGDMGPALEALLGPDAKGLSASTVARLKSKWRQEYEAWRKEPLGDRRIVYVWADGVHSRCRGDESRLCALVVIGVDDQGAKHLLAVEDGVRESEQSWREVLLQLEARGMNAPELAVADGALDFWKAAREVWPGTKHQRCWVHKTANVLNRLPKSSQDKAKRMLRDIWQADDRRSAERAFDLFARTYRDKHPKAVENLERDRAALLAFYDFPAEHWGSIRTTNPIESTFGTIRHRMRRTKGCLTTEGTLHMIYKLGCAAEQGWRRMRGFEKLADVIAGVNFKDGVRVKKKDAGADPGSSQETETLAA